MALWDEPRGTRGHRAEASALCVTVTLCGLIAIAIAVKWLFAVVL